jgi:hypothetical protein
MWDPKRIFQDRTPPPPKDAPRKRDGWSGPATAIGEAVCCGCLKATSRGAQITEFHPKGESLTESWHPDCWQRANFDVFSPRNPFHAAM